MSRSYKRTVVEDDFCGSKRFAKKQVARKIRRNKMLSRWDYMVGKMRNFVDINTITGDEYRGMTMK
jgi:hypothetical protein